MTESLPWVVFAFYITVGYLLVAGVTAGTVVFVAHSRQNQLSYAALALASLACAGYQLATAYYYQTQSEPLAIAALRWQVDFGTVMMAAVCGYFGVQFYRERLPDAVVFLLGLTTVMLVVANRTSPLSLHFAEIPQLTKQPHPWHDGLSQLQGKPGGASWVWHLLVCVGLLASSYWNLLGWRRVRETRAHLYAGFLALMLLCVLISWMLDWGTWRGFYPIGFALTGFVLWMSASIAMDAARNSRQLLLREGDMRREIGQRRLAEDKLQRLSQVFMQAPSPAHIVDLHGDTQQVNSESRRFLRRDLSAPPKVNFFAVLEQLGVDKKPLLDDLSAGQGCTLGPYFFTAGMPVDSLYLVRDTWLLFKVYPILDQKGDLQELVVGLEDVTERQFVESAIKTISMAVSTETGHAFFNQLATYLARLLNKKCVLIGLKKHLAERVVIDTLATAIDGELADVEQWTLADSPAQMVLALGSYAVSSQAVREFPHCSWLRQRQLQSFVGAAIVDADKNNIGLIAVMDSKPMDQVGQMQEVVNIFVARAATELHRLEAEQRIRKMAYEDYLTGLPNRSALNEFVQDLLSNKKPTHGCAFLQLDLDHFKTINDALGHDVGDDVLRCIGRRLQRQADSHALVARLGGDEFALIVTRLGDESSGALESLVQRVIALMEQPVQVGDHLLDLGCTIGVVVFPEFAATAVDVFRNADIALNKAKTSGRGGYQFFTPEMRDAVSRRLALENGLRAALQNREFELFYQPQVDGAGNIMGAEALIRWRHPEQGWIAPLHFIPVAEETGLINPIGQWVLEQALQHRKQWSEQRVPFSGHLSVNVSPWQFARPDFVASVVGAIQRLQVPPSHVTLEVTESALLTDIDDTIEKLGQLRGFGVTIALDDFGTGYSSLAYLRDLPLDILKIDKAFVDALEINAHEPLVESMITIGKNMGLQVVAEGVETPLQAERLMALGCNIFQGYWFSKPLPEPEFVAWLRADTGLIKAKTLKR